MTTRLVRISREGADGAVCEPGGVAGELLIVTGPPGAGKSSVAAASSGRSTPSVLIAGDEFFGFLRGGRIDPWLVESDRQNEVVTEAAGAATGRFVVGGFWTVYDGVIGPWFLPRFLAAAGIGRAHYVVLLPPVETCVARVADRVGHGFSDEPATRHMHAQFEGAELQDRFILRDAAAPLDEVVDTVADLVAGARRPTRTDRAHDPHCPPADAERSDPG